MALKLGFLLFLWGLILFVHGVASFCDVTCSTDYVASVNCSCSSVPTSSVIIKVNCSDDGYDANGSCEVKPPRSWCIIYPEDLDYVASIGTMCTATVTQQVDQVIMNASESSIWALSDVVKPLPPFDVQVTNTDGFYNVTWDHNNQMDCLMYSVRVRESNDLLKKPALSLLADKKYILLDHVKLQPRVNYTVDVSARMCPNNLYRGPWSEWSSSAEWRTTGSSAETEELNRCWWYIPLCIILVIGLLSLGYSQKTCLQKKFQLITFVPSPDEFFKPLDLKYGGNFKEWVKPVFSEHDYLRINSHVQMMSEKQPDVLQWKNEKQSYSEDSEMKQGGELLHMLQPHSNSLLFFQDGGSSQGTSHSAGHISIHTVTLSGEEEFEEEAMSQSSVNTLRSYQDGGSFGSFEDDNREHAGYDLEEPQGARLGRRSGMLPQHEISNDLSVENVNFQPHAHLNEPERVSLDSFASHEQSEDGYPHVDLDTIDSGFGECSSPGASDSNIAAQIDSNLFHEHKGSNSNYVKQWMICNIIPEDNNNSENELHESQ